MRNCRFFCQNVVAKKRSETEPYGKEKDRSPKQKTIQRCLGGAHRLGYSSRRELLSKGLRLFKTSDYERPRWKTGSRRTHTAGYNPVLGPENEAIAWNPLSVFDPAECQVNPRLSYFWFFRDFVLKVLLRLPRHDEQTPVRQAFRKRHHAILPLQAK